MRELSLVRFLAVLVVALGLAACAESPTPPPAATAPAAIAPAAQNAPVLNGIREVTVVGRPGTTVQNQLNNALSGSAVQACRVSDLAFQAAANGATGHILISVSVTNTGSATCGLPERPDATLIVKSMQERPQIAITQRPPLGDTPIRELAQGQKARFVLDWTNWCGEKTGAVFVAVKLAGDSAQSNVAVPDLLPQAARCDAPDAPSSLGVSPFVAQ